MKKLFFHTLFFLALPLAALWPSGWAVAHPMGNESVNHYAGFTVYPDRVHVKYILDVAEVPSFAELKLLDKDKDKDFTKTEKEEYFREKRDGLLGALTVELNGKTVRPKIAAHFVDALPGITPILHIVWIEMDLEVDLSGIDPAAENVLRWKDGNFSQWVGWKEIEVSGKPPMRILRSSAPEDKKSSKLTNYPPELITAPPVYTEVEFAFRKSASEAATVRPTGEPAVAAAQKPAPAAATAAATGAGIGALGGTAGKAGLFPTTRKDVSVRGGNWALLQPGATATASLGKGAAPARTSATPAEKKMEGKTAVAVEPAAEAEPRVKAAGQETPVEEQTAEADPRDEEAAKTEAAAPPQTGKGGDPEGAAPDNAAIEPESGGPVEGGSGYERVGGEDRKRNVDRASSKFASLLSDKKLPPGLLFVSLAIAFGLGASHALTPGHGKTIVAAYLVGSKGTVWHAVLLGVVVTVTHTVSVFAIGLVTLYYSEKYTSATLAPWMGFISGMLIVGIGASMFWARLKKILAEAHGHEHGHGHHDHDHAPAHPSPGAGRDLVRERSHEGGKPHRHGWLDSDHEHGPGGHTHVPESAGPEGVTLWNLLSLGVVGGIVPCPSATVVLLTAIALGRIALGLTLIVAFSLGLAIVLVAVGVLMVKARGLLDRFNLEGGAVQKLPMFSAAFITALGLIMAVQALVAGGVVQINL